MIFVLPVLFIATSCSDDDEGSWTEAQISEFLTDCQEDGIAKGDCECIATGLAKEISFEEFDAIEEPTAEQTALYLGIIVSCNPDIELN